MKNDNYRFAPLSGDLPNKDEYCHRQNCTNCGRGISVYIKKRYKIKHVWLTITCPHCGC
jgi:hypothetical protein